MERGKKEENNCAPGVDRSKLWRCLGSAICSRSQTKSSVWKLAVVWIRPNEAYERYRYFRSGKGDSKPAVSLIVSSPRRRISKHFDGSIEKSCKRKFQWEVGERKKISFESIFSTSFRQTRTAIKKIAGREGGLNSPYMPLYTALS